MRIKVIAVFLVLFSLTGVEAQKTKVSSDKILIVYLSRTRNTMAVAELIQQKVGGDLVALELKNPYPEDYDAIVKQVAGENESGFLPPLKTQIEHIEDYDVVFLGFPTWGMQLPPPIKSFLDAFDLEGKTVIPFNTHAGYGVGSGFQQVREYCTRSVVLKGFSVKGGIERDGIFLAIKGERRKEVEKAVNAWLTELDLFSVKKEK